MTNKFKISLEDNPEKTDILSIKAETLVYVVHLHDGLVLNLIRNGLEIVDGKDLLQLVS